MSKRWIGGRMVDVQDVNTAAVVEALHSPSLIEADRDEVTTMGTASTTGTSRLADDDQFLIAEARRIAPVLRARISDGERLAGELLDRLADLAERLGGTR